MAERIVFQTTLGELAEVPGSPYAYWVPQSLRELFQKYLPLDREVAGMPEKPKITDVKVGLQTSDDLRFTRFWWEVPVAEIGTSREETYQGRKWVPFAKGGKPFYHDIQLVVNWGNNGAEIKNFDRDIGKEEHLRSARLEGRRALHAYALDAGDRVFNTYLFSPRLGLEGVLDMYVATPWRHVPVDFKNACRIGVNHKYQLVAYALLLEDHFAHPVRFGFICLLPLRRTRCRTWRVSSEKKSCKIPWERWKSWPASRRPVCWRGSRRS